MLSRAVGTNMLCIMHLFVVPITHCKRLPAVLPAAKIGWHTCRIKLELLYGWISPGHWICSWMLGAVGVITTEFIHSCACKVDHLTWRLCIYRVCRRFYCASDLFCDLLSVMFQNDWKSANATQRCHTVQWDVIWNGQCYRGWCPCNVWHTFRWECPVQKDLRF